MIRKHTNMNAIVERISCELSKRPLLLPAVVVFFSCLLSVYYFSLAPIFLFILLCFSCVFFAYFKEIRFSLVLSITILVFVLINVFGVFGSYDATNRYDIKFIGKIYLVDRNLDGSQNIYISSEYGRILYKTTETDASFCVGDTYEFTGDLKTPMVPTNPGEFDYAKYLRKQGIGTTLKTDSYELVKTNHLFHRVNKLSDVFYEIKLKVLSLFPDESGLISSMLLGDTSLLDKNDRSMFNRAGCSHLLAVSGTHFAGFLVMLPFLFERFNIKGRKALNVYFVFCVFIGFFTGWSPSVTRAAFMSVIAFASRDSLSGISLATLVIAITDPFILVSNGFLMSFSCALAINFYSREISRRLESLNISYKVTNLVSVYIASQIGIMPFWITNGINLNIFNLPLQFLMSFIATLICILFVPMVCFSFVFGEFGTVPIVLIVKLMRGLIMVTNSVPAMTFNARRLGVLVTVSLFFLICIYLLKPCFVKRILIYPIALFFAFSIGLLISDVVNKPELTIVFIDVGQGDSCLIIGDKYTALIDGGTYNEGANAVASVLDYYSIDKVDFACMTHWDSDHAGGIAALCSMGRINNIYTSFIGDSSEVDDFIKKNFSDATLANQFVNNLKLIQKGDEVELGKSAKLVSVSPITAIDGGNEDSVVFMLESNSISCLFTGDIGIDTEKNLILRELVKKCDLLKVAHHGSKYSTSLEFLKKVNPEYAIISVAKHNNYGHPSREVISNLESQNIKYLTTFSSGAITVVCRDGNWQISSYL